MTGLGKVEAWFQSQGWRVFDFQREVWDAYRAGESGLIHSPTGTGKTFAAWLGPVIEALDGPAVEEGLKVLWVTPLRALAADSLLSLQVPVAALGLDWEVMARTGDTNSAERARLKKRLPQALVTTPESLTLMLASEDARETFKHLKMIVVDEWHELMSTKRGVQTELALARLRAQNPAVRTWGISATLGNLPEALECLVGVGRTGRLVKGNFDKEIVIDSVLPENAERFPWAGHIGVKMVPYVLEAIEESQSCLIFTNTRAQSEIWFQHILDARPDWSEVVALHHGSLSREVRDEVEEGLKSGRLRAVVCTSSLDLGVDFSPVDRVLQVGSPKGVARLLQRAGRSGHQPGMPSRVTCVPTHAFEMVDIAAARKAAELGRIEGREGARAPLDVLVQHLVSVGLSEPFDPSALFLEVKTTQAYQALSRADFEWALRFVTYGGASLKAYPEYHRLQKTDAGYKVTDKHIAQRHRLSIGTILSDSAMKVAYVGGGYLGTVEESFISRLRPGDKFLFAGRPLEFVRVKDMTGYVKKAKSLKGAIPRWNGGRMPLSSELSMTIREELDRARNGELDSAEMQTLAPILEIQNLWSRIPAADEFLIEQFQTDEGYHAVFYPFEGRLVHEGLAALFAYRISRTKKLTFTMACNDYGFELLANSEIPLEAALEDGLLSLSGLIEAVEGSLNSIEMAKRQFREVARISGLVFEGFPGVNKSMKQVQASSGLFFDVFKRYEPQNMLYQQAHQEVLEKQLEQSRLAQCLERLNRSNIVITHPPKPTPMCFTLFVDRLREQLSSETLADRVKDLVSQLERQADADRLVN
jgi:ATP-dependent helicase Lhr and Lhr-like helicase